MLLVPARRHDLHLGAFGPQGAPHFGYQAHIQFIRTHHGLIQLERFEHKSHAGQPVDPLEIIVCGD
jgi:hypothetical protein